MYKTIQIHLSGYGPFPDVQRVCYPFGLKITTATRHTGNTLETVLQCRSCRDKVVMLYLFMSTFSFPRNLFGVSPPTSSLAFSLVSSRPFKLVILVYRGINRKSEYCPFWAWRFAICEYSLISAKLPKLYKTLYLSADLSFQHVFLPWKVRFGRTTWVT